MSNRDNNCVLHLFLYEKASFPFRKEIVTEVVLSQNITKVKRTHTKKNYLKRDRTPATRVMM